MGFESMIAIISLIVAIVAGVAAFWSAGEARAANKRADRANELAEEANKRADKANSIAFEANKISKQALEEQKLHAPPPWSELIQVEENSYRLENQSGRDMEIVSVLVNPENASQLVRIDDLPAKVSYGDGYPILILATWQLQVSSIDIEWRFLDDPSAGTQTTNRRVN